MTHIKGWFTSSLVRRPIGFIAALSCTLVFLSVPVEARQRRAHLSKDLSDRLAARIEAPTDVIVAGSDEQVQALATALRRARQEKIEERGRPRGLRRPAGVT